MDGRLVVAALGWVAGWWLLWRVPLLGAAAPARRRPGAGGVPVPGAGRRVSVIVPARNEAHALPLLLAGLAAQTRPPDQVVVVDDGSDDGTGAVAAGFAGVTVVPGAPLPPGWTGKTWALHQGSAVADGDVLVLLDADVRLEADALEVLVAEHTRRGGLVSVQPYHQTERAYEQLAAVFNVVAVMGVGIASPGRRGRSDAAFGPCLVTTRTDYDRVGGHAAVRGEVVEDVALAGAYRAAGLPVHTFGGRGHVSFRMYPRGLGQLVEGFSKNLATGARSVPVARALVVAWWVTAALISVQLGLELAVGGSDAVPPVVVAALAVAFVGQLTAMLRQLGDFTWLTAVLYPAPLGAFVVVFLRSLWLTAVRRRVEWSGRAVPLSRRRRWAGAPVGEEAAA